MSTIARTLDEALAPITDGCMLAVPRESSGAAMAATRALVRRGVKRLHLITLPTSSLQADLLIGAGCVETLDTLRCQPRRVRAGAAFFVGDNFRRGPRARRHVPGATRAVSGRREGRAIHAPARPHRL